MYIIIYILFLVNFKRFRIIYIFLIIYISIILYNLYYHCNSHHHNKIDYFLYNNINIYAIYIYMRWNFFGFDNNLLDIHIYIYISLYIIIFLQYYFFFYLINCFCGIYVNEYYFQIGFCFFCIVIIIIFVIIIFFILFHLEIPYIYILHKQPDEEFHYLQYFDWYHYHFLFFLFSKLYGYDYHHLFPHDEQSTHRLLYFVRIFFFLILHQK